ncbi:unnamed protein product [Acanthocheilonema viteae]|uniref:Uncharacterized protein n=1 Tax=Acanthocheilonema viteae TaxID=6277 RepID=A0A498S643_ACAVI|nr:unnamed protein product [Acanthocheilonema viteae]
MHELDHLSFVIDVFIDPISILCSEVVKVAELESSSESRVGTLRDPSEVTARVERLLFDVINKAEMIAREIWPSDGGTIELNRKELKRFIVNNEAKWLSGSKLSRHMAGGGSLECSTDSGMQHISKDDSVLTTEGILQSHRPNHCKIHQCKREINLSELHSTLAGTDSDKDVKTQRQLRMGGNFEQVTTDTTSQINTTSITESPETLISSETTDLKSSNIDESLSDETESLTENNFMQNRGDQLVPAMKPDGTIVIPGVVHVNNFESLDGVVLELKVLIKSPKESRRINVKIDCPDFNPKSIKVNGVETHRLVDDHSKTS